MREVLSPSARQSLRDGLVRSRQCHFRLAALTRARPEFGSGALLRAVAQGAASSAVLVPATSPLPQFEAKFSRRVVQTVIYKAQQQQQQQLPPLATLAAAVAAAAATAAPTIEVTFSVQYRCAFGNAVHISGQLPELGGWRPSGAVRMQWSEGDNWVVSVHLPAGSQVEYKYVVCDRAGRPTRWQEGPNMVVALHGHGTPVQQVDAVDSWCQRMQLRRIYILQQQSQAQLPQLPQLPQLQQPRRPVGVWEVCGGQDNPCSVPLNAASNVVSFKRPSIAARSKSTAAATGAAALAAFGLAQASGGSTILQQAAATSWTDERLASALQQQQPPVAGGGSPASSSWAPPSPPGSPMSAGATVEDAQAALPSLQQELEAALAAIPTSSSRRFAPDSDAAIAADAFGAAVAELRQLQSIVLDEGGGSGSPGGHDVACLIGAFSPAKTSQDEDVGDDYFYVAAVEASPVAAVGADCGDALLVQDSLSLVDDGSGSVDPLVAALLSDDCELCCTYLHDAICSCGSGDWPEGDALCDAPCEVAQFEAAEACMAAAAASMDLPEAAPTGSAADAAAAQGIPYSAWIQASSMELPEAAPVGSAAAAGSAACSVWDQALDPDSSSSNSSAVGGSSSAAAQAPTQCTSAASGLEALRAEVFAAVHEAMARSEALRMQQPDPAHPDLLLADRAVAAANNHLLSSRLLAA